MRVGKEGSVFGQVEITTMRQALKLACEALRFAYPAGVDPFTERQLARAIVERAASGSRDAGALCASTLASLDPLGATYLDRTAEPAASIARAARAPQQKDAARRLVG